MLTNAPRLAKVAMLILVTSGALAVSPTAAEEPAPSQRKVLVAVVFDDKCVAWCGRVRPVMKDLSASHGPELQVTELDASKKSLKETTELAKQLGIKKAFEDAADYAPLVMIFDRKLRLVKELAGPKLPEVYKSEVETYLARN